MQTFSARQATGLFMVFLALISQLMLGSQSSLLGTGYTGTDTDQVLAGKSILFFGDSLTNGHGLDSFEDSWCGMLGTEYGMEVTTKSVSGSTIAAASVNIREPGGCRDPVCQRDLPEGFYDLIFLAGTGNDWYCEIPLGDDQESRDPYTEYGAINLLIDRVQEAYPGALIVCSTSWNSTGEQNGLGLTTEDYNQVLLKVCTLRGIPCFHANDPEVSGIDASTAESRGSTFLRSTDYWHLSAAGHKQYLPVIAAWLQSVTLSDYAVCGFYDVSRSDWFADDVSYVCARSIMKGSSTTCFSPESSVTRAQLVTMLYRLAGEPEATAVSFTDVTDDAWYADAASWAVSGGLLDSGSEKAFLPDTELTRAQLAVILYRYAGLMGYDRIESDDLSRFTDLSGVDQETRSALAWTAASGILRGTSDTTFAPDAAVTRSQAAAVFHRFCAHYEDGSSD